MSADFTAVISNGLASIRAGAAAAGAALAQTTSQLTRMGAVGEKEMKRIGEAVSKLGGVAGSIGGKLFGAAGMEGGIGRLAMAAVAAGIAFKAFDSVMQAATARASAFAQAAAGLRAALKGAADASRSFAAGSADTGRAQARAENLFGKDAGGRAQMMAKAFGIETSDVLSAMGNTGGIPANQRAAALEAAYAAAATGELSATDAIGMMSDPAVRAIVTSQQAGGGLSAAQRGAAQIIMRRRGARGPAALREAIDTVGGSGPARDRLAGVNQAGNITTHAQQAAFVSRATEGAMRASAAAAVDPFSKALLEQNAAHEELIRALRDASRKAGLVAETYAEVKRVIPFVGGEGSFEGQARRAEIAAGDAVIGMQGNN